MFEKVLKAVFPSSVASLSFEWLKKNFNKKIYIGKKCLFLLVLFFFIDT